MTDNNRWLNTRSEGGRAYDSQFERMKEAGLDVHGEANFVMHYQPQTVLDAGCGTGRVGIELARQGCQVVGVDIDPQMLDRAREKAPQLDWRLGDLATIDSGQTFELIVMAGNVMLFVTPDTEQQVILNLSNQLTPEGRLISGFQLNRGLSIEMYDQFCATGGLTLVERYATWDRQPWQDGADYAVSVHYKAPH